MATERLRRVSASVQQAATVRMLQVGPTGQLTCMFPATHPAGRAVPVPGLSWSSCRLRLPSVSECRLPEPALGHEYLRHLGRAQSRHNPHHAGLRPEGRPAPGF
jgi:hypothetical protein